MMRALSQTTGYAIRALSYMGEKTAQWVQVKDIALATGVPKPYLAKILHALGQSGLIRTKRGYRGGVALSRPAAHVTVLDVVHAVEHLDQKPRCLVGMAACSDDRACPVHDFWEHQRRELEAKLARITLAQVATFERIYEISMEHREAANR